MQCTRQRVTAPRLLGRACGAIQLKNPISMMVLGTASYPLSGNVARAHGRGPVGLRQRSFFLSHVLEIHVSPFKKKLYPLFCNLIDLTFILFITIYFTFNAF